MQLSDIEHLTAQWSQCDLKELIAVVQSTQSATPSAEIRWRNVKQQDGEAWLTQSYVASFKNEFQQPRITSMHGEQSLSTEPHAEHLVIRDLDLEHLIPTDREQPAGRVVAHADWRYTQSWGNDGVPIEEVNAFDSSTSFPDGYGKELHLALSHEVFDTLQKRFHSLPLFELRGISTLTPSHLRKGIAKRLTEWIFPYSDEFSLPVVLAASPLGLPLYHKCGFKAYREYDAAVELEKYGGEGTHRHVLMVRWPVDESKMPAVWHEWKKTYGEGS